MLKLNKSGLIIARIKCSIVKYLTEYYFKSTEIKIMNNRYM